MERPTLRIEKKSESAREATYLLTGRISSEHVPEITRIIEQTRQGGRKVTLDLEGVGLIDREAIQFFACGEGCEVRLQHCPVYVQEWLRCETRARKRKAKR